MLLASLAIPATAGAQAPVDEHPRIWHLRPIAERHFPAAAQRCPAGVRILAGGLGAGERRGGKAWAQAWDRRHTGSEHCEVRLREDWRQWGRGDLCIVLAHEWGHLAGREHTDDPDDVMYRGLPNARSVPGCARLFAWKRAAWARHRAIRSSRTSLRRWYALARRNTGAVRRRALAQAWHVRWRQARISAELRELRARLGP